jgi:transcriptional regulator with XRE-family HTH domain
MNTMKQQVTHINYTPDRLLDAIRSHLQLNSDGALAKRLKITRDLIKDIRHGHVPIGASMLMWMHEATGISIEELRRLMGDRRAKFRLSFTIQPSAA